MSTYDEIPFVPEGVLDPAAGTNEAIRILRALSRNTVISMSLTAPPGSEADGDSYIVGAGATGAWSGKDDYLAHYVAEGASWDFMEPGAVAGVVVNMADGLGYFFDPSSPSSGWQLFSTSSATTATLLTEDDETGTLPNSRQLLAGTNVTLDDSVPGELTVSVSGGSTTATYLTEDDETGTLPNSRQLLAGTNITFDDTTPGERTISSSGGGGGVSSGTSFPGSPSTDDQFYRTDRNIHYFYDGTRWLSVQQFAVPLIGGALLPHTASTAYWLGNPWGGTYDIYVEQGTVTYLSTTTTAANYFVCQFAATNAANSDTNLGSSVSGQGDTQNNWVKKTVTINTVVASSFPLLRMTATETGTSSTYLLPSFIYRLVG
jgi:hypothetical protein